MNVGKLSLVFCCTIMVCAASASSFAQNFGKLFVVDTAADTHDVVPGDTFCADATGRCSLRAAVEESNVTPTTRDAVIFSLPNPSVIDLSLGELAITGKIAIVGPGARRLTIQRIFGTVDHFRIFRVASGVTSAILRGIKIKNGIADNSGGGVLVESGAIVTVSEASITGNAAGTGGGIANAGNLTITRSLIDSNQVNIPGAENKGGGIANLSAQSTLKVINSTLTANVGAKSGALDNLGSVTLVNATIARNSASDSCTTMCNAQGGTVSVLNTIIGPDVQVLVHNALSGGFSSLGNNIVTDARGTTGFTNGANGDQVSDSNAIDPMLGSLSNNGGDTDTLPLISGSPAIDHGNACVASGNCNGMRIFLLSDQRPGYLRGFFSASVDVGAFEYNAPTGSAAIGFATLSLGRPAFFGGTISVATNAVTLQKSYSAYNPFGRNRQQNLPDGVWIMEIRSKRASVAMDPQIFASDDLPPLAITNAEPTFEFQIGKPVLTKK